MRYRRVVREHLVSRVVDELVTVTQKHEGLALGVDEMKKY